MQCPDLSSTVPACLDPIPVCLNHVLICLKFVLDNRTGLKRDDGSYKYRDVLRIKDPAELIRQVRVRGYCTNPAYDKEVMRIIQKWNLEDIENGGVYLVVT